MTDQNSSDSEPQYAGRFPKTSKKPEKGWKSSLAFGVSTSIKKDKKPIATIGKRTKERVKVNGTESDLFKHIWNTRPHFCEECGKSLQIPRPHNFDHVIAKSRDSSARYDPNNIRLLCYSCHHEKTFG